MLKPVLSLSCWRNSVRSCRIEIISRPVKARFISTSKRKEHEEIVRPTAPTTTYVAPPTSFAGLRIIALSSLALSVGLAPVIMTVEASLPTTARLFFVATAMFTGIGGTTLIRYMGSPHVVRARLVYPQPRETTSSPQTAVDSPSGFLELHTQTLFSRPRVTRIYDSAFLTDTGRGFATMELASKVSYIPDESDNMAREETVAETADASGKVLGRWIVTWSADGTGICRGVGAITRYVHLPVWTSEVLLMNWLRRYFNIPKEKVPSWQ